MNLEGLTVNILGDSITEGVGVSDPRNNRYDNILKRNCKLRTVYNYGVSGSRLAYQTVAASVDHPRWEENFCDRAKEMQPDADLLIVYGGINDYIHGDAPIGQMGDQTPHTFCGAVYYLMNLLTREMYPGKPVIFLTPARSFYHREQRDTEPSPWPNKRADAMAVRGYAEIILETAKQFHIPVLDLYHELGIDPNNEKDFQNYTVDGLHFNDAGHRIIASRIKAFLERL